MYKYISFCMGFVSTALSTVVATSLKHYANRLPSVFVLIPWTHFIAPTR